MNKPEDRIILNDVYEVIELISDAIRHSKSNKNTSERLNEAHDYVHEYCMEVGWGKNVWHTILDDAIRMRREIKIRKELEDKK